MNEKFEFSKLDKVNMNQVIPAYQEAFAGDPWFEVSKCADKSNPKRCVGELSKLVVGKVCNICGEKTTRKAYEEQELIARFEQIDSSRPMYWYTESNELGVTMSAFAWLARGGILADEKYVDVPEMKNWISEKLGKKEFAWLDEVFANKSIKPTGNLQNFGQMCLGLMSNLNVNTLAFRTINPAMIRSAIRDFGSMAQVFERQVDVPDRRDFVIINR